MAFIAFMSPIFAGSIIATSGSANSIKFLGGVAMPPGIFIGG